MRSWATRRLSWWKGIAEAGGEPALAAACDHVLATRPMPPEGLERLVRAVYGLDERGQRREAAGRARVPSSYRYRPNHEERPA